MKSSLVLILSLCFTTAFSQNFQPGFLIKTQSSDTLKGFVQEVGSGLPSTCYFKTDMAEAPTPYTAENTESFGVYGGRTFVSIKTAGSTLAAFGEVFVSGKLTLVYDGKDYFVVDKKDGPLKLETVTSLVQVQGSTFQKKDERYKRILNYKLADCKNAQRRIATTQLEKDALIELISRYNNCFDTVSNKIILAKKSKWYFGLIGGVTSTTLGESKAPWYGSHEDFRSESSPHFGFHAMSVKEGKKLALTAA